MSDTILEFCEECGEQFDYLPSAGFEKVCDSCAEKNGALFTNHQDETIENIEQANKSLIN